VILPLNADGFAVEYTPQEAGAITGAVEDQGSADAVSESRLAMSTFEIIFPVVIFELCADSFFYLAHSLRLKPVGCSFELGTLHGRVAA
jgi:hypothetical protein